MSPSLGRILSYINRNVMAIIGRELEPYGIGHGQFPLMMYLYEQDGVNQETMAQVMRVDKATIARNVQRLLEEGYIVRERDESDARSYVIRLTPKGREVEGAMRSVSEVVQDVLLKGLSEDEACRAREMLERMAANVIDHVEGRE